MKPWGAVPGWTSIGLLKCFTTKVLLYLFPPITETFLVAWLYVVPCPLSISLLCSLGYLINLHPISLRLRVICGGSGGGGARTYIIYGQNSRAFCCCVFTGSAMLPFRGCCFNNLIFVMFSGCCVLLINHSARN